MAQSPPSPQPWRASVLTIYPDMFPGPLGFGVTGQALKRGGWALEVLDIRDFARDKHRSVDDAPAGGGPGMVMRVDVAAAALDAARAPDDRRPAILTSPRGRRFDQAAARAFAKAGGVIALCGRFEGVDERIVAARGLQEWSLGDFVMSGGELAAMAMIDASLRLTPGVVGERASLDEESFEAGLLEYPHYARPRVFEGEATPEPLLSGDHGRIARWRRERAEEITRARRPDLWTAYRKWRAGPSGDADE